MTYIGYGKSSLDAVVEAAAARQGRSVVGDQFPDRGFFYRSDQFNFAKIGVPAIYLDTGTDFVDRPEGWGKEQIDAWTRDPLPPAERRADRRVELRRHGRRRPARPSSAASRSPQADELPTWNPGDEFEAARLEALAALGGGWRRPAAATDARGHGRKALLQLRVGAVAHRRVAGVLALAQRHRRASASSSFMGSKSVDECEPSQNGWLCDSPQRHQK